MTVFEANRRDVQFSDMNEIVTDIEQLASGNVQTIGKHPFAAIVDHLARTNEIILGRRKSPKMPLMVRLAMPLLRKRIFNTKPAPGFKLPTEELEAFFWNDAAELADAIEFFKETTEELNRKGMPNRHPIFGPATPQQIERLLLGHAAMHLSFVIPE
ncbi:MAG: DUF1569 domain-containing protein [Planctomycetota bacterium]